MNQTKIEWCDVTWNPVTGCKHGCPYCYAKNVAHRFGGWTSGDVTIHQNYGKTPAVLDSPMLIQRGNGKTYPAPYPFDFEPTFHRYRLDEPEKMETPKTIFVCSMADLFGKWVPTEWIVSVLDACKRAPQHRYLFLTKNPSRYLELEHLALLPRGDNFWYGSTVTKPDDEALWVKDIDCHWFVSLEPLHEGIDLSKGNIKELPEWVIVGAETGNRQGKIVPEMEWLRKIAEDCASFDIPLFMKDSLDGLWGGTLIRQFPWQFQ